MDPKLKKLAELAQSVAEDMSKRMLSLVEEKYPELTVGELVSAMSLVQARLFSETKMSSNDILVQCVKIAQAAERFRELDSREDQPTTAPSTELN